MTRILPVAAVGFSGWVPARESVDLAADGEAAIAMVRDGSYDLVLLDLMLPKANQRRRRASDARR